MTELQASEAVVSGQAQRIPAALKAQQSVMHATIHVTRAETGKVETYDLTMTPIEEKKEAE